MSSATQQWKESLKAMLQRDGRWKAFVQRRDGLKAGGMAPAEAWRVAAQEFPPLVAGVADEAAAEQQRPNVLGEALNSGREGAAAVSSVEIDIPPIADVNMKRDVMWIYSNMGRPIGRVDVKTAPSAAAYQWLKDINQNPMERAEFRKTFLVRLLPAKAGEDSGVSQRDDGRKVLELVDQLQQVSAEAKKA